MKSSTRFAVKTSAHATLVAITRNVQRCVETLGLQNGLVNCFVLHTTCGLTVNENADPDVVHDLLARLDRLAPWQFHEDRHREGNSAAHLKSSLLGSSLTIPVENGRLSLGTWQGIYLGEFDGPRNRTVSVTAIGS